MTPPSFTSPPGWERLRELARILRGPHGCAWDRAQSLENLGSHLVEETFELLEALRTPRAAGAAEELGDVLFLLSLLQTAWEEEGGPALDAVAAAAVDKIVARHPHVFAEPTPLDEAELTVRWERLKDPSARARGTLPPPAPALPALLQASRLQEKAAGVGFDWPDAASVLEKVEEELLELRAAMRKAEVDPVPDRAEPSPAGADVREELGDLMFSVVNLSRKLGLEPESILRASSRKFRHRFNRMAESIEQDGLAIDAIGLERLERYWVAGKAEDRVSLSSPSDPSPGQPSPETDRRP